MTTSIKNVEKQQQQTTKFRRERIIPLYKDETWSADLIDKSSLSKYNNNYNNNYNNKVYFNCYRYIDKICMGYSVEE